jgi:ADP-heptose:LPS heptosyltransferase/lauroyl/myristoyl acyltransferase
LILFLLSFLGRLVAVTPEFVLWEISVVGGELILWLAPRRRRVLRSNLHHAFPDRPRAWRQLVARQSSRRLVETALLSLAAPYLSERRLRSIATLGASVDAWAADRQSRPRPVVFATLHLALWEAQTWYTMLSRVPLPPFGIIYRPLDNPVLDDFVKRTRERHGMRLLSRKAGFVEAMGMLRENGCVAALFDQNAGMQGALTLLLGRVCSTTELPGLLASKFGAELRTFYPRRTGFWRVTFETDAIASGGTAAGATLALNAWFENAMADEHLRGSWLWAHDRWRNQDRPSHRLRLEAKRDLLAEDMEARGMTRLPRHTRIWVRLPNWLGDVVMALPLLRAIRASRPDAEITVLAKAGFRPLLELVEVADKIRVLPAPGRGYFPHFAALAAEFPDTYILLTNSFRGDLEAWLTRCPQRFGIVRQGQRRPLLTHAYRVPAGFDEAQYPQLGLWDDFLRHFGLAVPLDLRPFGPLVPKVPPPWPLPIGLIAGSENLPAKRWPVAHWRALIEACPNDKFVLFGTAADAAITSDIAVGFEDRVEDRAGKTDLDQYIQGLAKCRLLVANDTGGMHLANLLAVPVIALFGPTNPLRTGPVFDAYHQVLQPPGAPPTGGGRLADLTPEAVVAAVRDLP